MELVVNEWLPDWLSPASTEYELKKANLFLYKFFIGNDILVVKFNSRFREKIMQYSKQFSGYPEYAPKLSFIIDKILLNSQKCRLLYDEELQALPESVEKLLIPPFDSDKYLFEAACTTEDRMIITTDLRLIDQTRTNEIIKIVHFDDFISGY